MKKYLVSVEKRAYYTGTILVSADNADKAVEDVQAQIDGGELQITAIEWGDPCHADWSFATTDDVDDAVD